MATATATAPADAAPEAPKKKGKLLVILVALVVLLGGGGGAYYFLVMKKSEPTAEEKAAAAEEAKEAKEKAEEGSVTTIDPISINLADNHFLKIGIALQGDAAVTESLDGSKALNTVIDLYSGRSMEEIGSAEGRKATQEELVEEIKADYFGEVTDVYFTQYVMQ